MVQRGNGETKTKIIYDLLFLFHYKISQIKINKLQFICEILSQTVQNRRLDKNNTQYKLPSALVAKLL